MVDESRSVHWLEPAAWEHQRAIEVLQSMTLDEWLAIIRRHGYRVAIPAEEATVATGLGAGGQVIAVETGSRQFFILPPDALPALAGLLSPADYELLASRSADAVTGVRAVTGQEGED